jgi:hypothetical protein
VNQQPTTAGGNLKVLPRISLPHWGELKWRLTMETTPPSISNIRHQSSQGGRLPPIVLTSQVNLIQLKRQLKGLLKGNFEFCNTRNGARVVMKEIADFSAICPHFESNYLSYFTLYPKSQKPKKAVIQHLPVSTSAEDISDRLVNLGIAVIRIKQMSTTRQSPAEGRTTVNIPLFLITLHRMSKSHEIFKLTSLCHTAIKTEAH